MKFCKGSDRPDIFFNSFKILEDTFTATTKDVLKLLERVHALIPCPGTGEDGKMSSKCSRFLELSGRKDSLLDADAVPRRGRPLPKRIDVA